MTTSIEQVARLLAEIPYIEAHQGITIQEVGRVFGITPGQVRRDVAVAMFCGLPGGYPGDLIEVDLDVLDNEGILFLSNPTHLDRPLRLTVAEAASLQLALSAVRSLVAPETAAAIDSLTEKLAGPAGQTAEVKVASGDEEVRRVITGAITRAEQLQLTYDGQARGATTYPVVDPVSVEVSEGVAYLSAYSVSNDAWRTYRLDRIAKAVPTGEMAQSHGTRPAGQWADSLAASESVKLTLRAEASWVAEYYPTRSVEVTNQGVEVELPVVEPAWLVRLLLSLGDKVIRVQPAEYARIAAGLAREALAVYSTI